MLPLIGILVIGPLIGFGLVNILQPKKDEPDTNPYS